MIFIFENEEITTNCLIPSISEIKEGESLYITIEKDQILKQHIKLFVQDNLKFLDFIKLIEDEVKFD